TRGANPEARSGARRRAAALLSYLIAARPHAHLAVARQSRALPKRPTPRSFRAPRAGQTSAPEPFAPARPGIVALRLRAKTSLPRAPGAVASGAIGWERSRPRPRRLAVSPPRRRGRVLSAAVSGDGPGGRTYGAAEPSALLLRPLRRIVRPPGPSPDT